MKMMSFDTSLVDHHHHQRRPRRAALQARVGNRRGRAGGDALAMAHSPDMARSHLHLGQVLDGLANRYGQQKAVGPTDPYEMILFLNCGYPATPPVLTGSPG